MKRHHSSSLLILFFCLGVMSGCDFTSGLHQEILSAQEYVDNQNYERAVEVYERILRKNPSKTIQTKINYQLAEIYYLYLNRQVEAISHYKYIVDNVEDPLWQVRALEKIADINFSFAKNYSAAIKAYQTLLNFRPRLGGNEFYQFRIADSYFESGQYEKAIPLFSEITANPSHAHHIESYYHLGLIYYYQKKWDKAVTMWLEYIKREKRQDLIVKTKFLIANSYETSEKLKEAYNIYYSLLDTYPNPEIIKSRLKALYQRRVARKR